MTAAVNHWDLPVEDRKPATTTVRIVEEDIPCEHTQHPSVESVLVVRRRESLVFDFYRGRPEMERIV